MYWTEEGRIRRAATDGGALETLLSITVLRPVGVAVDSARGKLYWTDSLAGKIQRADLDGANVEDLFTTEVTGLRDIAADVADGKSTGQTA